MIHSDAGPEPVPAGAKGIGLLLPSMMECLLPFRTCPTFPDVYSASAPSRSSIWQKLPFESAH